HSIAEEVDPDRDAADRGCLSAEEDAISTGLAGDHEVVAGMFQAPAELFYLGKYGGRTRRNVAPFDAAEPGSASVTANSELDLGKRLALLHRKRGRPDGSCPERVALALFLGDSGLLRTSSLLAGLGRLTLLTLCFPLFSALEHVVPARRRQAEHTG